MGFLNMFYSFYWQGLRVDVNEAKKEKKNIQNRRIWKGTEYMKYMIETDSETVAKEMVTN